ncbi:hypothetical protein JW906_05380 [bacterium]|nr:hypothetical protein [bacterium]
MRKKILILICLLTCIGLHADDEIRFNDYFEDRGLRVDFYFLGNAAEESVVIGRLVREGPWPENPDRILDAFEYGKYQVLVEDIASGRLIFRQGFDCEFGEYQTTGPARAGKKKVYERSVRIPFPKQPVRLKFESRDRNNVPRPLFAEEIDPSDTGIIRETVYSGDETFVLLENGAPHHCVDFVFIGEGYTSSEREKFRQDAEKYTGILFANEPYRKLKHRFNVRAVFRPSPESAMDEPRQAVFRKTMLDASFNALGLDRYLLTQRNHRMREIAAQVPYDAIIVLVNSMRYGGGGIYNDYCITTVDNERSGPVFLHELGHSFAGLADEYYSSEVAYEEFYPEGVEPLEPNITALPGGKVKWDSLLSPGIRIPTEYGKAERDSLSARLGRNRREMRVTLEAARKRNASSDEIQSIEKSFKKKSEKLGKKLDELRARYSDLEDKVGAFEGAGYTSNGLYRPMINCLMIYHPKNEFCRVCQAAIENMIGYYSSR